MSFWQQYDRQIPYVDKSEYAKNGTIFLITDVTEQTGGNYGDQWILNCELDTGEKVKISFTKSPNRDEKIAMIRNGLDAVPSGIIAKLRTFKTKNGQTGYDIADPELEPKELEQISF